MVAFSAAVKRLVFDRDGGVCFRCGGFANNFHHRLARGAGGSRRPVVGSAANALLVCGSGTTGCHGWIESNRAESLELGWLVRRNGVQEPDCVPVWRPLEGRWVLLSVDGSVSGLD